MGCRLCLSLLLWGTCVSVWAIAPDLSLSQCVRELWQSDRGLPQNSVQAMVQSRDGYVWLATQEGLARFDGLRFTRFSRASHPQIPFNYIRTLLEDSRGGIWAGTNEGGLFHLSAEGDVSARPERLSGDVRSLCQDPSGRLWIGLTKGGMACLDGDKMRLWGPGEGFPGEQVLALTLDDQGRLLAGTNHGVFYAEPPFASWPGNRHLPSVQVSSLLSGTGDELWVGTRSGLVHWHDGRAHVYDGSHGLGFNWVWCLLRDRDGSVWVGSNGSGLSRIFAGEVRETLTIEKGLHDNGIWSLLEDREGGLWLGGNGGGLARYRPGLFVNLGVDDGLGNGPYSAVCEADDGALWVGTWWDGCYILSPDGVRHLTTAEGLPDKNISSLCSDGQGGMWVGTDNGGVVHLGSDGRKRILNTSVGLAHNEVYALTRAADETLWVGSLGGIQAWRQGAWLPAIPGFDGVGARCLLAEVDGGMWVGTEGRGLCHWQKGLLRCWNREDGLPSDKIFALCDDGHGGVWIGSQGGGLSHLDGQGRLLAEALPQLSGSPVFQILHDGQGGLWLSGNRGLVVLTAEQTTKLRGHEVLDQPARLLGLADGMASEECTGGFQPAGCRTRDGRLCWPTLRSVAVLDPRRQVINTQPPLLGIETLRVDGRDLRPASELVFPAGTKTIAIQYAAISHNSPQRVVCRTRLDGFDRTWIPADPPSSRLVTYTNLPPGEYRLRLEAQNEDGRVSPPFSGQTFSIKPFYYQTLLFQLALIPLFMAVSYALIRGVRRYFFLLAFWRKERMVGAYILEKVLGLGGSATVYRARHLLIRSRVVALKLLREDFARDPVQVRRFRQEAALIDRIHHPNIVRIIERGSHGNTLYLAMEYIQGLTLAARLEQCGSLPIPAILSILRQTAAALDFIHRRGIVHRDLKPRNLMLADGSGGDQQVKLLDFGIAKAPDHTAMTVTGTVLGTLAYLSPEQVQLGQSGPASDMYALGVLAYEMLTGRLPYSNLTGAALMREITTGRVEMAADLYPDCPTGLRHLILALLEKDPGHRPTAAEFLSRLSAP